MRIIVMTFTALLLFGAQARAEVLITANEAAQAESADLRMNTRGVTRGPSIDQISPNPGAAAHSPLELKIKFVAHNSAKIDPAAVRVIYEKAAPIDLTDRVRKYVSSDGIDMPEAEIPPGTHLLRIEVKDSLDRKSVAEVKLLVQ
jgi:hypothetical protein